VREGTTIAGVIFTDLGEAASFMSLDWVQKSLKEKLGFEPFPATLNLRLDSPREIALWQRIQREQQGIEVSPVQPNFCRARLYPVEILAPLSSERTRLHGAVLLPEVKNYPSNKLEVVAPVKVKDSLGVNDGAWLTLEFINP
jgi:CTP-dependent riboflavin kinase